MQLYEGKVKTSQPSLCETRDKWLLGQETDRSWCHRHTRNMIKFFWSQPLVPWALAATYGQDKKFLA